MTPGNATRIDLQAIADYRAALARTDGLIDRSPPPKTPEAVRERAEHRMARLRTLLAAFGDPHLAYPVVHIAGTSGKGSTAVAAAAILTASGLRTGLHTSPYLQVATEKLQIDGALIDASTFRAVVDEVIAAAGRIGIERVTYGEVWFVLVALTFARASVDAAVIEVGAGGRFDLTNVVSPAVSVITSIGLDHTETLGGTIPEIAWHKAGIIKPGTPVVSAVADADALAVIAREADSTGARLVRVVPGETFDDTPIGEGRFAWRETDRLPESYETTMPGRFQTVNAATALAAVRLLPPAIGRLTPETVRAGLKAARIPGRFERVQSDPDVVLDGAHNPQKMSALVADLRAWKDEHRPSRLIVVIGILESKQHDAMLAELSAVADEIVTTSPRVLAKPGATAHDLTRAARGQGFAGPIAALDDPQEALDAAIRSAGPGDRVVVTGSLYLVGNVRGRWYPDDRIVVQRTPWPS